MRWTLNLVIFIALISSVACTTKRGISYGMPMLRKYISREVNCVYYDHCICIAYAGYTAQSDVELLRRFYDVVVLGLPSSNMPHSSFNQRVQSHILSNYRLSH